MPRTPLKAIPPTPPAELRAMSRVIDESYKEFEERPRCERCGRPFTPVSETQRICRGECALQALEEKIPEPAQKTIVFHGTVDQLVAALRQTREPRDAAVTLGIDDASFMIPERYRRGY